MIIERCFAFKQQANLNIIILNIQNYIIHMFNILGKQKDLKNYSYPLICFQFKAFYGTHSFFLKVIKEMCLVFDFTPSLTLFEMFLILLLPFLYFFKRVYLL